MPATQFFVNDRHPVTTLESLLSQLRKPTLTIRKQTNGLKHILNNDRLEDIQLREMSEVKREES